MSNNELLEQFPTKRVAPFDGMPVTANAWREAHDYHREMQRFQTLLYHGHGIVQGLEVMASDPPSSVLVIKPGVAVDSEGRTIVIARETPFDIRDEMKGKLYLVLSHKESKPRAEGNQSTASDLRYIFEEFTIQIVQQIPTGPYIELARIDRQKRDSEIKNPQHSWRPGFNEIDMSHRQKVEQTKATVQAAPPPPPAVAPAPATAKQALDPAQLKTLEDKQGRLESELKEVLAKQQHIMVELDEVKKQLGTPVQTASATPSETITIGISYLGQANNEKHQRGITFLMRALYPKGTLSAYHPSRQIKIEDNVPLTHPLTGYTLVFLVGEGRFAHNDAKMTTVLYNYLREGGTLFIESCRYQTGWGRTNPSDQLFANMMKALGQQLRPLQAPHPLLESPHLFAAPPAGFENRGTPVVQVADGVIWSMSDYACLWQGERREGTPTREEIRTAIEWGSNIIEYAVKRRQGGLS